MEPDLIRCFFHEVGHFVAREVSVKHFGVSPVKEISLKPSEKAAWLYLGSTGFVIPEGMEDVQHVINVPEKIVGLAYGCFFESLYKKIPFENCFSPNSSGTIDLDHWNATLNEQGIYGGAGKRDELIDTEKAYFNQLKESQFFEKIRAIDVASFLIAQGNQGEFVVDLEKLRSELSAFLYEHETFFLSYMKKVRELIDKYKSPV